MAAVSGKVISFPVQEKPESNQRRTRRKDGLFQVHYRYKDSAGVSHSKIFYGKTQKEAENKKKAFERDLDAGLKADDKTLFPAYADHWMATYKADLRPGTRATYQHDVGLMKEAFKDKRLKEISLSDVQAWLNTRSGLSASAIKKSAMTARAIFEAARQDRLILFNPCDQLSIPKGSSGTHRALDAWERHFITTHCQDHRFYYAAMVMLYAGLRRGEVMALQYGRDIDLKALEIHVRESAHIDEKGTDYFIDSPKSAASVRTVPILPPLDTILASAPKEGLVLKSAAGKQMTESAFARCLESYQVNLEQELNGTSKRWATKEQLSAWRSFPIRCHDLRHTFCSMLYESGKVDVKTAQRWMGHADIMVTMRIYTHLSQQKLDQASAGAREYFRSISPDALPTAPASSPAAIPATPGSTTAPASAPGMAPANIPTTPGAPSSAQIPSSTVRTATSTTTGSTTTTTTTTGTP